MKFTMMAVDTIPKFRLAAFPHQSTHPEIWQLNVMSIRDVANILGSLGFLDSEACDRLANANATVTPQPGLNTIWLTALGDFFEVASPGEEPPSEEVQDGYMLMVQGGLPKRSSLLSASSPRPMVYCSNELGRGT